jgi:hypothetical protein
MCITLMRECVHALKPGSMSSDAPSTHMFASYVLPVARHKWQEAQLQLALSTLRAYREGGAAAAWLVFCAFVC